MPRFHRRSSHCRSTSKCSSRPQKSGIWGRPCSRKYFHISVRISASSRLHAVKWAPKSAVKSTASFLISIVVGVASWCAASIDCGESCGSVRLCLHCGLRLPKAPLFRASEGVVPCTTPESAPVVVPGVLPSPDPLFTPVNCVIPPVTSHTAKRIFPGMATRAIACIISGVKLVHLDSGRSRVSNRS